MIRGLMKAPAGLLGGFFAQEARDIINQFARDSSSVNNTNGGGFDLLAWNINRGRDHGMPRKLRKKMHGQLGTYLVLTVITRPISYPFHCNFD